MRVPVLCSYRVHRKKIADVRSRTRNCFSRFEGRRIASCRLQFRDLRRANVRQLQDRMTSCVSLARSVRIHTTRIPISDIHLSPREDFAIEGDAIVPASVAIIPWDSRYEIPPGVRTYTGIPMLPSVHCGTGVCTYEIRSRCRKMEHPLSMFRNGSNSDSGNFMLSWFQNPRSVRKKKLHKARKRSEQYKGMSVKAHFNTMHV